MSCSRPSARLTGLCSALIASASLGAQCDLLWSPGPRSPGPNGSVVAVLPLPNGELIAGGSFTIADGAFTTNIARWNGSTWLPLGSGLLGPGIGATVRCFVRLPNGDVVAGGSFTSAGGVATNNIARWNGSSWAPLGTGLSGPVNELLLLPNGTLVAGGSFTAAGGLAVNRIAAWNGFSWSAFGSGFAAGEVNGLAVAPNGDLLAAGALSTSTSNFYGFYRWDGVTWSNAPGLDPGSSNSVLAMTARANGEVVLSGILTIQAMVVRLATWNGMTLQPLSTPVSTQVNAMIGTANGDLVVGTTSLQTPVLRWDGSAWTAIAGAPTHVRDLAEDNTGRLIAGVLPGQDAPHAVSRYDGLGWQTLGAPTPPRVLAMVRMPDGDVVVGGEFGAFGGVPANNLARWNGSSWAPLGAGVDGEVAHLAAAPNGDLIASGPFTMAGGAPANGIARWDGQAWSTLGGGPLTGTVSINNYPRFLAVAIDGAVFTTVNLQLYRFDGASWAQVPVQAAVSAYQALAPLPNGDVALGGVFLNVPGQPVVTGLMVYQQGTVTPFPGGPAATVFRVLPTADGSLVVRTAVGMQRWDGSVWSALPTVIATGLDELPNGELVACGGSVAFGGTTPSAVYRLRNGAWESFGEVAGSGMVVTASGRGDLFAAGSIVAAAGDVSVGFAQAAATCPANASVFGSGCVGGAGPVTLVADNLPWVGGLFRSTATGMTANSLALTVFGVTPTVAPLPGGAPGCSLYVMPFLADLVLPANGLAESTTQLPNQPSLAGQVLRQQVVGIELSALGVNQLTGSNALELVIGSL